MCAVVTHKPRKSLRVADNDAAYSLVTYMQTVDHSPKPKNFQECRRIDTLGPSLFNLAGLSSPIANRHNKLTLRSQPS
jgi:hypothetical protein